MTQKDLLYIEDSLNHLKFISTQINDAKENVSEDFEIFLTGIDNKINKEYDSIIKLLER
ncbi:MAG: hypothetical protein ACI31M_03885 [Bacilli bacterium]